MVESAEPPALYVIDRMSYLYYWTREEYICPFTPGFDVKSQIKTTYRCARYGEAVVEKWEFNRQITFEHWLTMIRN
jgi:hypothetical protein